MHHLEVPDALAGSRIKCQEGISEEICARAIRAVEVIFRAGSWDKHDAMRFVERQFAPRVCTSRSFPGVRRPCVVPELARMRNRVKTPDKLATHDIVSANISRPRII